MLMEELCEQQGVLTLTEGFNDKGIISLKLGIGTLYVFWLFINNHYIVNKITGDKEGKEKIGRDPELYQWVMSQLTAIDPIHKSV